jgi:hypothetical protein
MSVEAAAAAAAARRSFVRVKRAAHAPGGALAYDDESYVPVLLTADVLDVGFLALKICADFPRWGVDAGQVALFLAAPGGTAAPTRREAAAVLGDAAKRLGEGMALQEAGIVSGAWLLARVPPPAAPGASLGDAGGAADLLAGLVQALPARILALMQAGDRATSPSSPAQRAQGALAVLAHIDGGVVEAEPRPGARAVLTAAQQAQLDAAAREDHEEGVVRFMMPVLAALRGCARGDVARDACAPVLVNSEHLPWLEHPAGGGLSKLRLKPDLFRTWAPFIEERVRRGQQGEGPDHVFGVLAGAALQRAGCVKEVYEATRFATLTRAHFGGLCAYHDALGRGVCRGVLFGPQAFWLYKTVHASPVRLVRACWAEAGSADVFTSFFENDACDELDKPEPPLLALLRELLATLGTALCAAADGRRYLGSGATGHVFAVCAPGGGAPARALKVVLSASAAGVAAEYERMGAAAAVGAPVVPPVDGSLIVAGAGGGFLLSRVGAAAPAASASASAGAFAALAALHAAGVTHGDARLANLLDVDGELRWIDLVGGVAAAPASPAFAALARADAETLARSLLRAAAPAALPEGVAAALGAYAVGEPAAASALARAVWTAAAGSGMSRHRT